MVLNPNQTLPPKSLTLRKDQNARQAQLAETKLRKLSRYVMYVCSPVASERKVLPTV